MVDVVVERDDTGGVSKIPIGPWAKPHTHADRTPKEDRASTAIYHVLADLFLPAGYPTSVSPDYLEYQVYNALQAFFNSISGLLASRGALEGVGVGDASVSATYALLLTVLKDTFSRLTTILAAYCFGTSLYPETKPFRFLADVFNDVASILDTIVPFIGSLDLSRYSSTLPSGPTLQIVMLCLSGGMRSLCGLVAGGSKTALTIHFASPLSGKGDIGEVSAKDASRETVVGLSGMLFGMLLMPYVNTGTLTYSILLVLIGAHLLLNYLAVRSVVLRTLNRQRACILWTSFKAKALSPATVASKEVLFTSFDNIRDARTGRKIGRCYLGTSFGRIKSRCTAEHIASTLHVFKGERYVVFLSGVNSRGARGLRQVTTFVCFKDGYRSMDQLQAWIHAIEVTRQLYDARDVSDPVNVLHTTLLAIRQALPRFVQSLAEEGWETGDDSMMFGTPNHLILDVEKGSKDDEDKKRC